MTESARIGSAESSEGSSFVRGIDFPKSQLAKSSGKFSARNLQVLSYIAKFYHFKVSSIQNPNKQRRRNAPPLFIWVCKTCIAIKNLLHQDFLQVGEFSCILIGTNTQLIVCLCKLLSVG